MGLEPIYQRECKSITTDSWRRKFSVRKNSQACIHTLWQGEPRHSLCVHILPLLRTTLVRCERPHICQCRLFKQAAEVWAKQDQSPQRSQWCCHPSQWRTNRTNRSAQGGQPQSNKLSASEPQNVPQSTAPLDGSRRHRKAYHRALRRHSCGTNLLSNGANIKTVASILGHIGLAHTEKYVRAVDSLKQAAIYSMPPLEL